MFLFILNTSSLWRSVLGARAFPIGHQHDELETCTKEDLMKTWLGAHSSRNPSQLILCLLGVSATQHQCGEHVFTLFLALVEPLSQLRLRFRRCWAVGTDIMHHGNRCGLPDVLQEYYCRVPFEQQPFNINQLTCNQEEQDAHNMVVFNATGTAICAVIHVNWSYIIFQIN